MTYRVSRKTISNTFEVQGQICKVFMQPLHEYEGKHWLWNVGFAIGSSRRQLNDWYWKSKRNKRCRSLNNQMVGRSGIKAIAKGFETVLRMRWHIPPGDAIVLDCTSGDPDRQFRAWSRWHKHHPEWVISYEEKKFYWYRPPYPADNIWKNFNITAVTPDNPLENSCDLRYFDGFRVQPKVQCTDLSNEQTLSLLSQVLL